MGFKPFADQAAEFRKCASALRRVDQLQEGNQTHRIDRMEPLAGALDEIGRLLEEGLLQPAKNKAYVLLVAVDKAATLNVDFVERSELARALGKIRTHAKSNAARKNGLSGGRPRKDGKPPRRKRVDADDLKVSEPL